MSKHNIDNIILTAISPKNHPVPLSPLQQVQALTVALGAVTREPLSGKRLKEFEQAVLVIVSQLAMITPLEENGAQWFVAGNRTLTVADFSECAFGDDGATALLAVFLLLFILFCFNCSPFRRKQRIPLSSI